jgi:hypothetical protein
MGEIWIYLVVALTESNGANACKRIASYFFSCFDTACCVNGVGA